jgi:hypothetical protein
MTTVNILMDHNGLVRPTELEDVFELKVRLNRFQGYIIDEVEYVVDDVYYQGKVSKEDGKKIQKWMTSEYKKLVSKGNRNKKRKVDDEKSE